MRVLMVTWDGAGNQLATLGVARSLVGSGHDVRMLGHHSVAARTGNDGWRFRPFEHTVDYDSTHPMAPAAEMALMSDQLWFSADPARDLRDELDREPADVLVVDAMLVGALCAGEASGVPTVALFHSAYAVARAGPLVDMLAPAVPLIDMIREDLALPPVSSIAEVHDRCALALVATAREFEPDLPLPANVSYVGPILDGPSLSSQRDDVDLDDGRTPLVLVSFSTSDQAQRDVLQRCVDALAGLPVRAVVTTGPAIDPESLRGASNTKIVRFVPHHEVLPRASLVVTHAGLGTVMSALHHGVPMVCIPLGRDQFFNAAMVERLGTGHALPPDADSTAIAAAVSTTLEDESRAGAKRMANVLASYGGGADAVAAIERTAAR